MIRTVLMVSATSRSAQPSAGACVLAAALLVCVPSAFAQADGRIPPRKAGLWETSMEMPTGARGGAAGTMSFQQCVDSSTDDAAQRRQFSPDPGARCTTSNVRTGGGGYEADYQCDTNGSKVSGHVKMSGDLSSRYTLTNTMRPDAAGGGSAVERTVTIVAQHKGACPADMKPGESRMAGMPPMPAGGGRMTPEQMQQMIEQMKRGGSGR